MTCVFKRYKLSIGLLIGGKENGLDRVDTDGVILGIFLSIVYFVYNPAMFT